MRVLIWGVAPWLNTGYGRGCRHLARGLRDLGYEVQVFAFYGLRGALMWEGIPVWGNPSDRSHSHIAYVARLVKPDCVIAWFDLWTVEGIEDLGLPRLIAYAPVDGWPVHPEGPLYRALSACDYIVPYTEWARQVLEASGLRPLPPIPHGVDTAIFRPGPRAEARRALGWPEDGVVLLTVAVNRPRKNLPEHLHAYAPYAGRARYYLWTQPWPDLDCPDAEDLPAVARALGIPEGALGLPGPEEYKVGLGDRQLATLYRAADWHILCSYGEGYGFPTLEAMACGVPSVVTAWGASAELVGLPSAGKGAGILEGERGLGVGWSARYAQTLLRSWQVVPSALGMEQAIGQALETDPARYREACREYALERDWGRVLRLWDALLREI